ncbi:hypothetical protein P8452_38943 [Trifolium repens]|nr:hypothetical protein P8452_38943 [Trifolium repens]
MQLPIVVAVAATTSLVALFIIGFIIFRCLKKPTARDKTQEPENTCLHFSIEEIRIATKNFNDGLIIGNGGFGNVYKGNIERCHAPVAIKRLRPGKVDRTVDPVLKGTIKIKCLMKFVEVALSCLHHHGKQRPLMRDVVMGLECAWNLQHGGAHVKGKEKIRKSEEEKEIEVESFGRVEECSSSKGTTITSTCSEEEQALVMVGGIHESLDIP